MLGKLFVTPSCFFDAVTASIGVTYASGAHRNRFIDALLEANPLWYPLRYPGQFGGSTINDVIHYHYPSANDIAEIMSLRTFAISAAAACTTIHSDFSIRTRITRCTSGPAA